MIKSGHLPLWNPHQFSGMPFWADPQTALLYPLNLLVILLTDVPYQALEGLVILHIALTGWLMYGCLRLIRPKNRSGHRLRWLVRSLGCSPMSSSPISATST